MTTNKIIDELKENAKREYTHDLKKVYLRAVLKAISKIDDEHKKDIAVHRSEVYDEMNKLVKEKDIEHKNEVEEIFDDVAEIYNNINDDLEMDKKGESGYKTYKEVVEAIKKYTLKVIQRKYDKYKNKS